MQPISIKKTAHQTGWLYLAFLVIGVFNFFYIPSIIYVHDDAVRTAKNILENEFLFRLSILSNLAGQIIFIFLVLSLYQIFAGVNRAHARIMVALVIASVPASFLIILHQFSSLTLLSGANFLQVFADNQLQALSMYHYESYNDGIKIVGIFWGLWLYPFGWLVIRSGFMPKLLGVLLIIGCFAFLIDSGSYLLIPKYYQSISNVVALPMTVGEISMIFWLIFKGVKGPL